MKNATKKLVREALREDQARADITSRLLFDGKHEVDAKVIAKEEGVVCGVNAAAIVFKLLDRDCGMRIYRQDGNKVAVGDKILSVRGDLSRILAGERTALNILQHLSGIATLTRRYVDAIKGTRAKIYDTRKTTPGLRVLEKYAVRCGGGMNQRMNLKDAAMVKDNHLKALFGSRPNREAKRLVLELRARLPKKSQLMIEATCRRDIDLALAAKADVIMLDNMPVAEIKQAVRHIHSRSRKPRPLIEATGGVSLRNVRQIARAGVDRISVGKLTHSNPALDISLEIV